MASIEKRGPYQWRAKIRRRGNKPQTKTFESKQEALAWARMIESEMDRGVFQDRRSAESTTLKEVLDKYAREISPLKRGELKEIQRIKQFKLDPISERFLASIHGQDISEFRDRRLQTVQASTVNRDLNLLSHVFSVAMRDWGYHLSNNPLQYVTRPKVKSDTFRNRRLEGDEEVRLLKACSMNRNPYLHPLVIVAIETAMRRGELLSLTWDNVKLAEESVYLPKTKNDTARKVPLSPRANATLGNLPRSIDGRVFPFKSDNAISMAFRRACKQANIENIRFHDLRHEATSRIAEKVPDVHTLARITGHKNLQMLLRYYHPKVQDLAKMLK